MSYWAKKFLEVLILKSAAILDNEIHKLNWNFYLEYFFIFSFISCRKAIIQHFVPSPVILTAVSFPDMSRTREV